MTDNALVKYAEYDPQARAEEDELIKQEGGGPIWKPRIGMNTVRVLPPATGRRSPFRITYSHNIPIPGVGDVFFVCPRMESKLPCPACQHEAKLTGSQSQADQERAKKFKPKRLVYCSMIDRDDEAKGVQVYRFGPMVHDLMRKLLDNTKWGDFSSPVKGYDLSIIKTEEANGIRYNVQPNPRTVLHDDATKMNEWLAMLPNLDRFIKVLSPEDIMAKMRGEKPGRGAPRGRTAADDMSSE